MLLNERPIHGYGIIGILHERLGRPVSPAIVYPFLAQLLAVGYLTSTKNDVGKKTRTLYSMTPEGRKFSNAIFKRLSQVVSPALEPGMLQCAHCGCKLYEKGHSEDINGSRMTFCCVHCANAYRE
jgi:DNA-binding PadR family transcriptional regulator